jgi:WD40 repeat protein
MNIHRTNWDISTGVEQEVPTISTIDSLNEEFATWNSSLRSTSKKPTSIPPFFDEQSEVYGPSSQFQLTSISETNLDLGNLHTIRPMQLTQRQEAHRHQYPKSRVMQKETEAGIARQYSLRQTLEGHTGYVLSVVFSPDAKRLASGSGDCTVRLWDAATGKALQTLEGYTGAVGSVVFSPDAKRLASGSGDRMVRLWDAAMDYN